MKKSLALLCFLFSLATLAHAAQPTPESVERMLEASNAKQNHAAMHEQMLGMQRKVVAQFQQGKPMSEEEKKVMERFMARASAIMYEEFSWDKLKPFYLKVYGESFTQEEVDKLTAFYQSDTGRLVTVKLPSVMLKFNQEILVMMGPMQARLNALAKDMAKEISEAKSKSPK